MKKTDLIRFDQILKNYIYVTIAIISKKTHKKFMGTVRIGLTTFRL